MTLNLGGDPQLEAASLHLEVDPAMFTGTFRITTINYPAGSTNQEQIARFEAEFANLRLDRAGLSAQIMWQEGNISTASLESIYEFVPIARGK
jgi:hypothetical protein